MGVELVDSVGRCVATALGCVGFWLLREEATARSIGGANPGWVAG